MKDDPLTIIHGDALSSLRTLESESVQCCVTSPPYWGLRSYGTEPVVWGGDPNCDHSWLDADGPSMSGGAGEASAKNRTNQGAYFDKQMSGVCDCGAWRGELGLEPTPEMYVDHVVQVFRELKRVLRNDGTLWLNLGDSYFASGQGFGDTKTTNKGHNGSRQRQSRFGAGTS